jgi:predicted DNA-binding transcriptional regulator AlpA
MPSRFKPAGVPQAVTESPAFAVQTRGHTRPRRPLIDIDGPGRLRVAHILALFSISHSTLYARIRDGKFPARDGVDGVMPYWLTSTIRPLLKNQQ